MNSKVSTNVLKNLGMEHNVTIRVLDSGNRIVSEHEGHNVATNSMLTGIAHYLLGDGVFNQGGDILTKYVPQFMSLGTMGLYNQDALQDSDNIGLPAGIGKSPIYTEEENYTYYMTTVPGYGADGYDANENNSREYMGLGRTYTQTISEQGEIKVPLNCELISETYPRSRISYREIVPEYEAEMSRTIDIVLSAMVSTGALSKFRGYYRDENYNIQQNPYIFITEAGLWSKQLYEDSGENGLLAAYRIVPNNEQYWDMSIPSNRKLLRENIIRVGINQVVQIIWKIQIGSLSDIGGSSSTIVTGGTYWQVDEPDNT